MRQNVEAGLPALRLAHFAAYNYDAAAKAAEEALAESTSSATPLILGTIPSVTRGSVSQFHPPARGLLGSNVPSLNPCWF